MYQLAGEKYVRSNKFNAVKSLIGLVVSIFAAIGIGRLYAIITMVNPIIYLNFLVLAGAVLLLVIVITMTKLFGKSRNILVDIVTSLVICFTAWLAHWAHIESSDSNIGFWASFTDVPGLLEYVAHFAGNRNLSIGRFGSSGSAIDPFILMICYLVEFGAFAAPAYFALKSKEYYCEECDTSYLSATSYIDENDILVSHPQELEKGDLRFLAQKTFYKSIDQLPLDPKEKPGIASIELHYCKKCNANPIVNIKTGILKLGDKNKREITRESSLLEDTYITNESMRMLTGGNEKITSLSAL